MSNEFNKNWDPTKEWTAFMIKTKRMPDSEDFQAASDEIARFLGSERYDEILEIAKKFDYSYINEAYLALGSTEAMDAYRAKYFGDRTLDFIDRINQGDFATIEISDDMVALHIDGREDYLMLDQIGETNFQHILLAIDKRCAEAAERDQLHEIDTSEEWPYRDSVDDEI